MICAEKMKNRLIDLAFNLVRNVGEVKNKEVSYVLINSGSS